uniref:F-box domain-containing protein n=1 Tax=Ditylenchus dipsaci TaxID=166011 RepID=A0A915ERJ1_9BILA
MIQSKLMPAEVVTEVLAFLPYQNARQLLPISRRYSQILARQIDSQLHPNQCKKIGPEARRTIHKLAGIKKNAEEPLSNKVTKRPGSSFSSSPSITNYFG